MVKQPQALTYFLLNDSVVKGNMDDNVAPVIITYNPSAQRQQQPK